jgi:hypothetical protein
MDNFYYQKYIKYKKKYIKLINFYGLEDKYNNNDNPDLLNIKYELLDIPIPKIQKFPNKDLEEIIWLNKNNLSFNTHKDNKKKLNNNIELPHGLKISGEIKPYDDNIINILKEMFLNFKNSDLIMSYKENNTLFLKKNKEKGPSVIHYTISDVYNSIGENNNFKNIIKYYFEKSLEVLNVDKKNKKLYKYLENSCKFSILHYKTDETGLHCHIDNISGGDGPLITIGIGSSFYYDFRPIFYTKHELKKLKPFRIHIKNNQITIMDGESRYCWQHCIPYGYIRTIDKFTIKLIFPKFEYKNPKYNSFFNQEFTTSY